MKITLRWNLLDDKISYDQFVLLVFPNFLKIYVA